ncbi:SMAD/FHA domain-containing protein [Theobroma cacao]|uniref:SMAD/FHA domain-containing protein n=1 Tax=Theobroma cacao TaxID=3641 RepID=A0A061ENF0_THECC|nr:SMAD/FHA domain-containing protein [Theobroma cacao]
MTTTMGPPPPRNPNPSAEPEPEPEPVTQEESEPTTAKASTGPPPPPPPPAKKPNPQNPQDQEKESNSDSEPNSIEKPSNSKQSPVPYTIPQWSGPPSHHFFLEILKDGCIIDQFKVNEKGAYMFGRVDLCDFVLEHPTISRFHAVLQFRSSGQAYLYDLGSTHGTFINKSQVTKRTYVDLNVGDVIRFGHSSRLYIFQGPSELMPPEKDLKIMKDAKIQEEMLDREASLRRARAEASLADGISWGIGEDAIEEAEDDADEMTWQTYKGQLTEKQEKTHDKIIKRTEKIAHMKKEIDAIRAKDIAQGGLTQGQQTQIARNEQRITQIMEELENLEETLNESIRESIGARAGRISHGKRKGGPEDDDEDFSSDDDEFYDRTKKKPTVLKVGETQSIETADSLLDKRDAIMKEIEDKKELLLSEENKMASETALETEAGDALDAYMSGLSSQLVLDRTVQLEKELFALQSELDRIFYLLKIADPTREAAKKRDTKAQAPAPDKSRTPAAVKKQPPLEPKISTSTEPANSPMQKEGVADVSMESSKKPEENILSDTAEVRKAIYTVAKPQWLGAVESKEIKESQQEVEVKTHKVDQFVDYKDRKKVLGSVDDPLVKGHSGIETTASGLIIRKQKQVEKSEGDDKASDQSTSSSTGAEEIAQNAVALLLKHTRGYHAEDEELHETPEMLARNQLKKKEKKPKRVMGPEKPSFLNSNPEYESWVPPEGQSGDGRTTLNDRYGY